MKNVKITNATFKVVEFTKRTKKVKSVEITITYDNAGSYTRLIENLDKYQFQYRIPFTMLEQGFTNFSKGTPEKQLEVLTNMCNKLIDKEVEVGNIGVRYIDLEVESTIRENDKVGRNIFNIPSYCYVENDMVEMYDDTNELSEIGKLIKTAIILTK